MTIGAFYPYVRDTLTGAVRPHVFTWIIWTLTTFVVFFAQLADGGGAGSWATGVSALITMAIALLAWSRRGDFAATTSDWGFFLGALGSLPLWYYTDDPFWAVVLLTFVDTLGFGPTVRKAYREPHAESPLFYSVFAVRNVLGFAALEKYTATTVLFHAVMTVACAGLALMILWRRRVHFSVPS